MRPLTVVILAAGRGRRLAPLTDALPKCLLPLGDSSPLELQLGALAAAPVGAVHVVVGHAREAIDRFLAGRSFPWPVRCIFNPRWDEANNVVSAAHARQAGEEGFVLVNSDVVCDPAILADATSLEHDGSFLVVDPTTPPRPEAMKVRYEEGRLREIRKDLPAERADGEYIGIARLDRDGACAFFACVEDLLAHGGDGEWYEAAIAEASRQVAIGRRSTRGLPWIEIDDPDDFHRAESVILPILSRSRTE